ncbi:hypothetical protein BV97_03954 [Novosphingobium resinovorum]|uniref:Uncharacterized protein n=1 Tax=Novosphingobium resinovorum TaxID=158500 RepID=A0A031JT14_9SPHN|nr:hypothetical protein [Novosphingobium resinovorum]EZP79517.1 hypothetical protein BV97_03954 [Novosphingobium resinovorum]
MLELKIKAGSRYVEPSALASRFGAARALEELGDMIEYLIAQVDFIAGDPDEECNGDLEPDDDGKGDPAWPEWHTLSQKLTRHGTTPMGHTPWGGISHEDDEDDDAAEDDDPSGQCDEDGVNTVLGALRGDGPGCEISDPDQTVDDVGCDEEGGDMLPVLDWCAHDQTEPIVPSDTVDDRIMAVYRDRIRNLYYVKRESIWPGQPPVWHRASAPLDAINLN